MGVGSNPTGGPLFFKETNMFTHNQVQILLGILDHLATDIGRPSFTQEVDNLINNLAKVQGIKCTSESYLLRKMKSE